MSTPLIDPSSARASLDEHQIQSMQRMAESSRTPLDAKAAKAKEKKLREACEGFEAVFVQKMWEGMRASLPKEGPMHSRDEQFWQGMYDQELGKSIAASGGIGLADMMMSQLSRNLQSASEVAANANGRTPMPIAPVPLVPASAKPVTVAQNVESGGAADMYSGEAAQPDAPVGTVQNAAVTTGTPVAAVPNPTPPEIMGPLNEFATQLGTNPANLANLANPANLANAQAVNPAQATNPLVAQALQQAQQQAQQQAGQPNTQPVAVVPAGQTAGQPGAQTLVGQMAQSTAQTVGSRATGQTTAQPSTGARGNAPVQPTIVHTRYITNDPQRVTRQNRASQRIPTGNPVSGRSVRTPAQTRQAAQQDALPTQTGLTPPLQAGRPSPLGQPNGAMRATQDAFGPQPLTFTPQTPQATPPQALFTPQADGLGSGRTTGSNVAYQQTTASGAGLPDAAQVTAVQQQNTGNIPNSLTALTTTGNRR